MKKRHELSFLLLFFLQLFLSLCSGVFAQEGDLEMRAVQWNGYGIPPGQFIRHVDRAKGWSLWYPAAWKNISKQENDGSFHLMAGESEANLLVITESIPDGYGVANYTSAVLQQFRNERVNLDQVMTRRVFFGGIEGREIILEMEADNGTVVRQTIWLAAVGPRAYGFFFGAKPENYEAFEPYFKRIMMTARLHAAGHWNHEFETLRARFVSEKDNVDGREIEAAQLTEIIRTAKESTTTLLPRIADLISRSPDAALEMLTDGDAQVRAATIRALGEIAALRPEPRFADVLLWALGDKEAYCNAVAAQAFARLLTRPEQKTALLQALKREIEVLSANPASLINLGLAFDLHTSRVLTEELLSSSSGKRRAIGLQLAIMRHFAGLRLPFDKLLQPADEGYLPLLGEAAHLYQQNNTVSEILPLLKNETEAGAARVLGELGSAELLPVLEKREREIDAQFEKLVTAASPPSSSKKTPRRPTAVSPQNEPGEQFRKLMKELGMQRLADARREISEAADKIRIRERWGKAGDDKERRALLDESAFRSLREWAEIRLRESALPAPESGQPLMIDLTKLSYVPTTGANLFPQNTSLYLMAPNFEQTLSRLNASLAGVQMNTVRDQMTFALMLNIFRSQLAGLIDAEAAGSLSRATGIDFRNPVSIAEWNRGQDETSPRSAMLAQVTDRERFERTLGTYQSRVGSFDSFAQTSSILTRFAGTMPAVVPLTLAAAFSEEKSQASSPAQKLRRIGTSIITYRHEQIGNLPVTIIEKTTNSVAGVLEREQMHVAYFGNTAVITPSRLALTELLRQATTRPVIEQNEAFTQALGESGELIYFSDLKKLYSSSVSKGSDAEDFISDALARVLGNEYGGLRLTANKLESVSHLSLGNNDWFKSVRPFKSQDLSAPRDLLPASTVLYTGSIVDPAKFLVAAKALEAMPDSHEGKKSAEEKQHSRQFEQELEKLIYPHLHGEMAFVILNLAPSLRSNFDELPAWAFALKLKSSEPATLFRTAKLFKSAAYSLEAKVFNSPVATAQAIGAGAYFTVTDNYLIFADSLESLKLLEGKEKLVATRGYARAVDSLPDNLALFATFSPDAALEEARKLSPKDENAQRILSIVSAMSHAFHSQRAYVSVNPQSLDRDKQVAFEGNLSVSFDREGRYIVGRVGPRNGEFDVANALITPKGLNILQPTRLESMRLRVTAKQPDIIQRVRDDISAFAWQKADDAGRDNALVYTTSARRISDKLTVKLPVTLPELQPFLRSTTRINSDASQVVELAKKIAGRDRDGRSVARKLGQWTHTNLKWKKVESTTLGTLASREADCLEHSELYAALARSLGLPARVVSGAAFSGGAFGAHAWVEIWLGRWVEVDPTWGLMDYVDATHLRFGSDGFVDYAMLNQVELEVLEARATVADFQRDPVRLVKEFSIGAQRRAAKEAASDQAESEEEGNENYVDPTRLLAFDLGLTVQQALGADAFAKLNDKQRNAVVAAFERSVNEVINDWLFNWDDNPVILSSDLKTNRAELLTIFGDGLLRMHLAARDGAWYITEIENVDEATHLLGDAVRGAIHPIASSARINNLSDSQNKLALKKVDELLRAEGESPSLLLLKARVLEAKESGEAEGKPDAGSEIPAESEKLVREITRRWPDYAPAWYRLSSNLATEKSIEPLQQYAKLMPLDPRPWERLGRAFSKLKKNAEAENAFREAIARDRKNHLRYASLTAFLTEQNAVEKARQVLLETFRVSSSADEIFDALSDEVTLFDDADEPIVERCRALEQLLTGFSKELSASRSGLRLLSSAQQWQANYDAAIKTLQRITPSGLGEYEYTRIAWLHRSAGRYAQALTAANQAVKTDAEYAGAHYERACNLVQLKRYREAITALRKAVELDDYYLDMLDEDDLKPLADMPEFRALRPKEEGPQKDEKKPEITAPQKPEKL